MESIDININCSVDGSGFALSRMETFPTIDLYLDQVLGLVERELGPLVPPGEKLLTGSMVNNYVKRRLIPTPVRKKYNRRQVAMLVVICFFKQVYSMTEVSNLLVIAERSGLADIKGYDTFVALVNNQYTSCRKALHGEPASIQPVDVDPDVAKTHEYKLFCSAIASVCERAVVEFELRKTQD